MYFTHLHTHSHYSLLDGLAQPEKLLLKAKEFGFDSLALTDHGVLYGAIEFYSKAKELGIKPIIGVELYLAPRSLRDKMPKIDNKNYHLTLLAKNEEGYQNLLKLVTIGELEGFYYKPRVDKQTLKDYSRGLIALSGCAQGEIPRLILNNHLEKAKEISQEYQEIFEGNFYLELQHHPELKEQLKINQGLLQLSKELGIPAVVTCDNHYLNKEDKKAHEVLLAVQTNSFLEEGERFSMAQMDLHFKSPEEVINDFKDYPFLFDNIKKIVDECNLELKLGQVILPHFEVPSNKDSFEYLKELAYERFPLYYSNDDLKAKERLEYELEVIKKTGFADYFLIINDIIKFARENNILTNTRGSAAGSLVAYILSITAIDPIKYNLYFERFLNPERIQPPDIDLDVSDVRRGELINYITNKYGQDHVAQIVTFGIMKARLAVRDVCRALGKPYSLGDKISKLIPFNLDLETALNTIPELKKLAEEDEEANEIITMAKKLEGVARHASTHAAGVIISREPLTNYTPLQHSSRSDKEIVSQYDMYSLEKIGLLKIDILGLANLTIIKNSLRIIKKVYNEEIDLDKISFEDPLVYKLLSKGETIGIFQVESAGMRKYLQQLKPNKFDDLIAMIALYRPGPMEFIPTYIRRKHGLEKIEYLHPKLKSILERTYGICVYQEQLMEIAHEMAGFTMGEADILRKAVGKKIKSLLKDQKVKFVNGMVSNGYSKGLALKIWEWIEPFARYGFNAAHAASYARIAYQTAWLKAHYPNAFMAALLTSDFGNLDRIAIEINECERLKIKVLPPSVNESFAEFGINKETGNIHFGLSAIKNVGVGVANIIQEERQKNGPYKNLTDFLKRLPKQVLNKKTLESLIQAGALDCFGSRELLNDHLEEILKWINKNGSQNSSQMALFKGEEDIYEILKKKYGEPSPDKKRRIGWEKDLLGLYLTFHPLDDYKNILEKMALKIGELSPRDTGKKVRVCGFISKIQMIRTKLGQRMVFTRISDYTNSIEVVLYPSVLENNLSALEEDKVVLVEGRIGQKNGNFQIIGERLEEIKTLDG